jgi:hypothetical protein
MKDFKEFVGESSELEMTDKEEMVELLMDLDDQLETALEVELISLLISMIKVDKISFQDYDAIVDAIDEVIDFETVDLDYDEDEDEPVDEVQRALYKRRGYVTCPDGRIRKRGKCGHPVDRKKSRKMIKARKKFKRAFQKGVRKAKRTKRRLGLWK